MDLGWEAVDYALLGNGVGVDPEDGPAQLAKALYRRLITYPGELPAHPEYGCRLRDYVGQPGDAWQARLAALEAKAALERDPRVREAQVEAWYQGEGLVVEARVRPVEGLDEILVRVVVPQGGGHG